MAAIWCVIHKQGQSYPQLVNAVPSVWRGLQLVFGTKLGRALRATIIYSYSLNSAYNPPNPVAKKKAAVERLYANGRRFRVLSRQPGFTFQAAYPVMVQRHLCAYRDCLRPTLLQYAGNLPSSGLALLGPFSPRLFRSLWIQASVCSHFALRRPLQCLTAGFDGKPIGQA